MAKVYITEFSGVASMPGGSAPVGAGTVRQQAAITSSGTSQQSAAINGGSRLVRIHTDGIISIAIGADPTATVDGMRMAANQTEYFAPGVGQKIAIITNT